MEKTATTVISEASIAASATTTLADCTAIDLSRATQLIFTFQGTFNASATGGATVKFYTSTDNTTYDTSDYEWDSWSIAVSAGSTIQATYYPTSPTPLYIKATITNNDTTYAITNAKLIATVQTI